MPNINQYIIVQGPTKYYKELIESYQHQKNIIISTLDNEPLENINELKKYFKLIVYPFQFNPGTGNLNCQTITTTNGLLSANTLGATHALKIRSDMIISDVQKFMKILEEKPRISFLAWHIDGYLIDYLNYGSINDMIDWWNVIEVNINYAERNLINHFSMIKKEQLFTISNIKKHVDFFMEDLHKANIHIHWLKNNIMVSEYHKHECYKY